VQYVERYRQVDGNLRVGYGHARHAHWRSRICALSFGNQG
jgi:hypothetical protein